jgi:hypothetical protein
LASESTSGYNAGAAYMIGTVPETQIPEGLAEPHRFSRAAYEAMVAAGILDENDRVELIAGEILTKMPIGPYHASTVNRLNRILSKLAGDQAIVSVQNPIALDSNSEPEPDLALLAPREPSRTCRRISFGGGR